MGKEPKQPKTPKSKYQNYYEKASCKGVDYNKQSRPTEKAAEGGKK